MSAWERWSIVALVVASVAQGIFVVTYATRPWWRDRVGRALMLKSSALCVALWLTLLNSFFVYPGEEQIGFAAMAAIAAACTYQLVVLLWAIRQDHR